MGRITPEIPDDTTNTTAGDNGDLGIRSNDRSFSLFKRTLPHFDTHTRGKFKSSSDRLLSTVRHRSRRKGFQFKVNSVIYSVILVALFGFVFASIVLQTSITSVFRQGSSERGRVSGRGLKVGSSLTFVGDSRLNYHGRLDQLRKERRTGFRPPKLAIVLGNAKKNPEALMLFTVMKNLQKTGYMLKIYALEDGEARAVWEEIGGRVTILNLERNDHFDWSFFDGIIAQSLEAEEVISSLMQEPFCSVPLIWIIQEDRLAKRLLDYHKMGWEHLISHWRSSFKRADVVVFPDFSLPMLYSSLDSGNFFVIPGSPVHVWAADIYVKTHSKHNLRTSGGYKADDIVVLVVESSIVYTEFSWDYFAVKHIGPLLVKYGNGEDFSRSLRFIFLCGNSTGKYSHASEGLTRRLGLTLDSVKHYSMDQDVDAVLLMADIVIYGSLQNEQAFPPLLTRAMSLGIPVVVPDLPIIRRYVTDGVHGMIFSKHNPDDLLRIFSLLLSSEGKLSKFADTVGSNGKHLAKNFFALESITGYVKLMENVINFPSDASLPAPMSQIQQDTWEWDPFDRMTEQADDAVTDIDEEGNRIEQSSIVYAFEEDFNSVMALQNATVHGSEMPEQDLVMEHLSVVQQIENFEEYERLEKDQIEERMEKDPGVWDEIYRNARKSEKLKFEPNERDEGELERIGSLICIYEVYNGAGTWPFLHHGSLYRGLSLSTKARRLSSDDVDAVNRLPFLNNSRYRDLLCEMGGMFSIAYKVDDIHKKPWIGFQSWKASGRKVSLSIKAERILEETIQHESKGDTIYFWTRMYMDSGLTRTSESLSFWSICDVFNGGKCRTAFENAFRHMYGLPSNVEALPPMPKDHGHWSSMHSWVMPTSSFLEFVMFSRIFVDSLDAVHRNASKTSECHLGFSDLEKKQCYCRILELLVNVWAYHSARRMVYIDPRTGMLEEQHPLAQRHGFMWAKYFDFSLLKNMDEDLAEASDDGDMHREEWLWPLTGEVHWKGIYEREREERYRIKMDKKRKIKEKLLERMKYGYKQKSLGR